MLFRRLFARVRELLGTWRIWLHGPAVVLDVQERIHQCRSIVDFSFARDDTNSGSDLYHRLALRAKANRHLVDAMGINNSLTTADPDIHRAFLKKAATQLRKMAAPWHWQRLYASAAAMLEEEVSGSQVLLAPLVRSLCLRVVMQVLFGPPSDVLDTTDVVTVCSEINRQWMLSKQDGERGTQMQQSAALNEAMARLLLQHGEQADLLPQAALELILPAYEALWRVVLLTFVTACHRTREGAPQFLLQTVNMASVLGTGSAEEKQVLQIAKVCTLNNRQLSYLCLLTTPPRKASACFHRRSESTVPAACRQTTTPYCRPMCLACTAMWPSGDRMRSCFDRSGSTR